MEEVVVVNNGLTLVRTRQLRAVIQRIRDVLEKSDSRVDQLVARLKDEAAELDARLDGIEEASAGTLRLELVANVAGLPQAAQPLQWYRVAGDPAVYVGNGAGKPLRKIMTEVL